MLFEKDCAIVAEPRIAHILPEHFSEPNRFQPERFLNPQDAIDKYAYIPFGGGIHGCLGAQLAIVIGQLSASHLLQQFEWTVQETAQFVQFPLRRLKDNYPIQISTIKPS